ncbi:MAG: arginine N-succinyltransferase [Bdellovibrionota bacterium]
MNFVLRSVRQTDLKDLMDLAGQFTLLNLPADKKILGEKVERSVASFAGELPKEKSEYLFVVEDLESKAIVGSSLIMAKHGTEEIPHHYFRIVKKDRFSEDLGIGFIHQVLQFKTDTNGPTEIGGLLIDKSYRRRPEKLGRQISLVRFLYMAMYPDEFSERVLCELTPPLGEGGRSEFWEALGRRFTGLPYQEADLISQRNKEFITSLFPEEDIYLCLLDAKARVVLGRVGDETRPAQHLLESIGFKYLQEVDPFDGGPHYGADLQEIKVVKDTHWIPTRTMAQGKFASRALVGIKRDGEFRAVHTAYDIQDREMILPEASARVLEISAGDKIAYSPAP